MVGGQIKAVQKSFDIKHITSSADRVKTAPAADFVVMAAYEIKNHGKNKNLFQQAF